MATTYNCPKAHPRSRGENPRRCGRRGRRSGLIPAHAGKTPVAGARSYPPTAHPRSRGENVGSFVLSFCVGGSSPLTRGKHPSGVVYVYNDGLIPAHAGKTRLRAAKRARRTAHPRSRGENQALSHTTHFLQGSSPLTRGKLQSFPANGVNTGLIPAHAGKTIDKPRTITANRAHPRSRGENPHNLRYFFSAKGSSPLTRGKQCKT